DLRTLVANDRSLEAKALYPGQGTRKGPAGAGDDGDPRAQHPAHRVDVARIQLQRGAQDRSVQVEGKQPEASGYFLTSGVSRFGGLPPRAAVAMFLAAIADISERVRTVALAMCGASTTLGM